MGECAKRLIKWIRIKHVFMCWMLGKYIKESEGELKNRKCVRKWLESIRQKIQVWTNVPNVETVSKSMTMYAANCWVNVRDD